MKRRCAKAALAYVPQKGLIGLGGGETIQYLAEEIKESGRQISIVSPSPKTREICESLDIEVVDMKQAANLLVAFDGCDQVDRSLNALKSKGGIHTKEKITASMAKEYILLADESKVVDQFDGKVPLVLEIVEEAAAFLISILEGEGYSCRMRSEKLMEVFLPDERSYKESSSWMKQLPGVIETSFFDHIAKKALVVTKDGTYVIER